MCPVKIRIRGDHLRLKPDTKLKSDLIDLIHQIFQTSCDLFFVYFPVTQGTVIGISFSKPAIIHDQHLNATFFRLTGNSKQFICIEIKIGRFPVVDQDRAFLIFELAADQMIPVKVMITSCHLTEPVSGIGHDYFRCLEGFARFKEPGKFLRADSHGHTQVVKLAEFCLCQEVSGIDEMHGIDLSVLLVCSVCHKSHKRMLLMAGFSSCGRDHLFSIMELSGLDMAFSCPGSVKRQHGKILIVHIQADT